MDKGSGGGLTRADMARSGYPARTDTSALAVRAEKEEREEAGEEEEEEAEEVEKDGANENNCFCVGKSSRSENRQREKGRETFQWSKCKFHCVRLQILLFVD